MKTSKSVDGQQQALRPIQHKHLQNNPFQWLDRWPVTPVVTGAFAFFVSLIIILGIFERGPLLLEYPATLFLFWSLFTAAAFTLLFWGIEKISWLHRPFVFPVLVTGLAAAPRFVWMRLVETTPLWDFARYLNYARSIVGGDPGAIAQIRGVFPHLTGYPLVLSWVMQIFGTETAVARWFNFFCTLMTVLLLYELGKRAFSPRVGRGAALLFALWPGQIYYSNVLGAEHLFTMVLMGVLLLFVMAIHHESGAGLAPKAWTLALAAGTLLSLAHVVRPVASLLFPAFLLYLCLKPFDGELQGRGIRGIQHLENGRPDTFESHLASDDVLDDVQEEAAAERPVNSKRNPRPVWQQILLRRGAVLALLLAGFLLTLTTLNAIYEPRVLVPLGKTGAGFNLYVGTNQASRGMWSADDWAIIEEYNYDFDRIHEEAWRRGMERIQEDYRDFWLLVERKFAIQWAVSDYGFYWGMLELDRVTAVSLWAEEYRQELQVLSQVHYLNLMWLTLAGLWLTRQRRQATFNAFIAILFFGFIAMHVLIEVQSRYHHSLVPLFMLSAAYGGGLLLDRMSSQLKEQAVGKQASVK
ncbi:ArnT family glycosyltransferase [Anoxynatronum buryatiense]|uniref:Dolichyl-phosphate-mannose-protein mannosyltransferase n=1 Tax=Anoxynatronum buryatiense TaxID=489973 RepID=A0AA45WVV0_9CLOT|nr:glycosyltransferase family 39 protein [Anoxynatronum buryatiense]SMP55271.1 Dolichyl-phosphate-mannose-protein mannosyltransferase [Anoxynatronum buryatiense]